MLELTSARRPQNCFLIVCETQKKIMRATQLRVDPMLNILRSP